MGATLAPSNQLLTTFLILLLLASDWMMMTSCLR